MLNPTNQILEEQVIQGAYGNYTITSSDRSEVQKYRLSVLACGISFTAGLAQWAILGPSTAWLWLITMAISLGLALKWIHIYLRVLHQILQIFWAIGCLGIGLLVLKVGSSNLLSSLASNQLWLLAIGPLFAALTGLGFKEFFCFRRPEAIGLTMLLPIALLSHLIGLLNSTIIVVMLSISSVLLLILALRKFGMNAGDDIGDKSVFEYLEKQTNF